MEFVSSLDIKFCIITGIDTQKLTQAIYIYFLLFIILEVESPNVTQQQPTTTTLTTSQTKETRKQQKYTRSSSYEKHSNQGN